MAWYSGSAECRDDQSVYLLYIDENSSPAPVRLGDKTGNPVVWQTGADTATLLWSRFEDVPVSSIVDRWKHCSLWVQQIKLENGQVVLGKSQPLASKNEHLLGRCNPIWYNGGMLLPLYNELDRYGIIYKGDGWDFQRLGIIGKDMIQPTIWRTGDKIGSLSRNFGNNKLYAQYSESEDGGLSWTDPVDSSLLNNNSSVHVVDAFDEMLVLWNNTASTTRTHMTLGRLNGLAASGIKVVGLAHGAYPSMCFADDWLHFSFTRRGKIEYYGWNRHKYESVRSGNTA